VTSKKITNIPSSVKQRLLLKRNSSHRTFEELLQYYAIERFLYRLSKSEYKENFVLKGAMMLYAWGIGNNRPTMDIDMLGRITNDPGSIEKVIREICLVRVESDGLNYDLETTKSEEITTDADYKGVRITFFCFLENTRIRMQIDIGFGDSIFPKSAKVTIPSILDFTAPELNGYTIESSIAEKFQAMLRLGELNSRMKDFYDIWLFSQKIDFKFEILTEAIKATFITRDFQMPIPESISIFKDDFAKLKQRQWKAFHIRIDLQSVPEDFTDIIDTVKLFLYQITDAIYNSKQVLTGTWNAPGPWSR
jgi:predicted nucleotidyltransferase component of viral defense system